MTANETGNGPHVVSSQPGQLKRWCWYSVTTGLISGSSHTWCRRGAGSAPDSLLPQRRQAVGLRDSVRSHCSVASSGRGTYSSLIISLDPAEAFEISAGEVMGNAYDRLLRYDVADPSKLLGDLARIAFATSDRPALRSALDLQSV